MFVSKKPEALRKSPSRRVMLRIPVDDLDRARRQAACKGIGYQAYIKILLLEGLDRHRRTALEVLRGTADTRMSTEEILALTRGENRSTTKRG